MPSGPLLRILVLTCAGMLPCDASLARRDGSNNSGLRQIPSARAVQVMSLGMAHVPRQEAAVMIQRVYDELKKLLNIFAVPLNKLNL